MLNWLKNLHYALWGSEMMELEKAKWNIKRIGNKAFLFGCDARSYYEMPKDRFVEYFTRLLILQP